MNISVCIPVSISILSKYILVLPKTSVSYRGAQDCGRFGAAHGNRIGDGILPLLGR